MALKPPYATGARIVGGQLWIRMGAPGWQFLKQHPECGELVCPEDREPAAFEWVADGLDIYIVTHDPDIQLGKLINTLLAQRAKSITVIHKRKCGWADYWDNTKITQN